MNRRSVPSDERLRFERKFLPDNFDRLEVEHIVRHHPAEFRAIFLPRQVNNIYLDTIQRRNYWDSVDGAATRVKTRIRWYGETFGPIDSPVLEFKHKAGLMVWKDSYPLSNFSLDQGVDLRTLTGVFCASLEPGPRDVVRSLIPVLLNRYQRSYFLSGDKEYRITVDDRLHSFRLRPRRNTFLNKSMDDRRVIVELKYDLSSSDGADNVSRELPFRVTRWSKYVSGLTPNRI
jgi:hypothetical protein